MLYGVILGLAVGAVCIVLGALLWKKRMVSILHEYQYRRVKKEDIPAYTRKMGIGLIIIGAGIAVTGLMNLVCPDLWWIPFLAGFVFGAAVIFGAQKKYNG